MKRVRITLKNYRAFADEEPLQIEIGPGLTAIVGRNNSGKSAIKLFFYEFRNMFHMLLGGAFPNVFLAQWAWNGNYLGVTDPSEVFHNGNSRPLVLEIEIVAPENHTFAGDCLLKLRACCHRNFPMAWSFSTFPKGSPDFNLSTASTSPGHINGRPHTYQLAKTSLDCNDFLDVIACLTKARYFGPFRNAINEGAGSYYDLQVGTSFVGTWDSWKTSGAKQSAAAIEEVTEDIRRLLNFDRLEINASRNLNTLIVLVDKKPYRLAELGSGLAQFILTLGNAAVSRPSLLLIDEPETNLHPALQIDFLLSLAKYASTGVVFSTHSIGLARSVAEQIYSVQKFGPHSKIRQFEATDNYVEFVGELSFSAFKDMGYDNLLLVEGVNDVKVVQQLLRLFHKEQKTVILPLGGNQFLAGEREQELSELTRLSKHIFVLVDSERVGPEQPLDRERGHFFQLCSKLGFTTCITERRAIENYFPDHAVKGALGDKFSGLKPYERLKDCANPWGKTDNWRIAREMTLADLQGTDIGRFLSDL